MAEVSRVLVSASGLRGQENFPCRSTTSKVSEIDMPKALLSRGVQTYRHRAHRAVTGETCSVEGMAAGTAIRQSKGLIRI